MSSVLYNQNKIQIKKMDAKADARFDMKTN